MNPNDPNVALIEVVADRLGNPLREAMVFVGGAVAGLLITDPAMPSIRPTEDVDLIVQVATLAGYHEIEIALRQRGFVQDLAPDAPICRWRIGAVAVDVMPTLDNILGFSNRWYPLALHTAQPISFPSGTTLRLITAPVFLGTKLEAFAGRGNSDYLFSHDLGDLIAVVDGRDTLIDECRTSDPELRAYLGHQIAAFLACPAFVESLPGHLPPDTASQARTPELLAKLQALSALNSL